ncbi:MAG: TolC family protein, partial [Salinisphaera sp.]|nr:TolC family protein [Salinisphaera sp.]
QGNIAAARAELSAARRQRQAAIIRVRTALGQRYQELQAAREAAAGLARKALPAARSAYEAIRTAYRYGHRGFLDVLIAQRTLFDVKARYIEALANYHRTAVAVERLIVRPLNGIATDDAADPATSEQGNTP